MILQTYVNGSWLDAAEITFFGSTKQEHVRITYLTDYLINASTPFENDTEFAVSVNAPVSPVAADYSRWPALFDDLLPVGKTRQWWITRLDISHLNVFEADTRLLEMTCAAPIGNLRIKEAFDRIENTSNIRFPTAIVCKLDHDFLEYANSQGAAVGGATGAVGVAPKLLLMLEHNEVYIDADFAGNSISAKPYLVKFARNQRTQRDNNILRAEGVFYKVLPSILQHTQIPTMDPDKIHIKDVDDHISLWLPRFDVFEQNGKLHRLGVESIYSIINAGPGSAWDHFNVIEKLWEKLQHSFAYTKSEFVTEYVIRDLLNVVFGNSDNHGRNISFIKKDSKIYYAPIYDFAPMKADEEQITRLFKWGDGCEIGGDISYQKIALRLQPYVSTETLLSSLRDIAKNLVNLHTLLVDNDCPEEILAFPTIGFVHVKEKMMRMGLIND